MTSQHFLIHFELHFLKIKLVFLENNKSTCLLVVRRWESAKWQDDDETNIPIDEYSIRNGFERQNYKTTITIIAAASWIEVQLQFSSYPFFDYCHIKWHVWRIRLTLPFLIRNTDKYRYVRNDLLAKRVSRSCSLHQPWSSSIGWCIVQGFVLLLRYFVIAKLAPMNDTWLAPKTENVVAAGQYVLSFVQCRQWPLLSVLHLSWGVFLIVVPNWGMRPTPPREPRGFWLRPSTIQQHKFLIPNQSLSHDVNR